MERQWYRVKLKETAANGRRRRVSLGGGTLIFDLGKEGGAEHVVSLTDAEAESLRRNVDFSVTRAKAPKPGKLAETATDREVGGEPVKPDTTKGSEG